MIQQRRFIGLLVLGLLSACGSGSATNPPSPRNQDPVFNPGAPVSNANAAYQSPPSNDQDPLAPNQRPAPPNDGIIVSVGPTNSSGGQGSGGRGNGQSGSDNSGPGKGDGGRGNMATCKTADFCVGCDLTGNCRAYCECVNQLGGTNDCAAACP